ncbi:MAG: bifunctional riboflavin kinase/FAD synthetase [Candidatus Cloacimonetes bacterium]|jgi:riboflavin kinase/FMN adenylyltransferase|nr:bifunctional riboflavin kinase/FAD synthetase [Candidatus Cloacimonadota bacterium]
MKYFKAQKCDFTKPVVTMGTFDGVHRGHVKLLKQAVKKAKEKKTKSVVITYYHHPLETIHKKTFPYLLTERENKEKLIKECGIDCVLYLEFDEEMAQMQPEDFLQKIIITEIGAQVLIVGYDTHFGNSREGNYQFLIDRSSIYNYCIKLIEPVKIDSHIISSSLIRDYIREGDMQYVSKLLGRNYSIHGSVQLGHRIGRKIGFPTINLQPLDTNKLIPAIGVYVCEILVEGKKYFGVTNIGYSPTLKTTRIKEIETHILDFDDDLYHKEVEVCFNKKLRDELQFNNKNELIEAIGKDIIETREFFKRRK